jgi:hypothetical protein
LLQLEANLNAAVNEYNRALMTAPAIMEANQLFIKVKEVPLPSGL